jgi:hypothetical protein
MTGCPSDRRICSATIRPIVSILAPAAVGTLEDAKEVRPTPTAPQVARLMGPSTAGTKILNGKSRQVGPGDMVIIPANTPHTLTEITTDRIVIMVVRVDPHKVLFAD